MISNLRLIIAVFALGALPVWGQDDVAVSGKYFHTMGADVTANDLYFSLNGKDKNIDVINGVRSIVYNGKGTGKLVFYRIATGPDGKPIHINAAQADITSAGILALLTFFPVSNSPGNYDVEVLPDDLTTFPLGSYRIVNRSSVAVKVTLGDQSADVAPHEVHVLIYPHPTGGGSLAARIYSSNKARRLLYADTWGYVDKCRTEILLSPRQGLPDFINVSRLCDNPTSLLLKKYLPKD